MKKLILPKIIILLGFILFVPFSFDKVYAQDKEPLNCEQLTKILGSEKCAPWVMTDYSVWCAQTEDELLRYYTDEYGNPGIEHLYRNRAPDYTVDRSITLEELNACGANSAEGQVGNAKGNSQNSETGQSAKQGEQSKDGDRAQVLNDWIKDTFSEVDFEAVEAERLYGRTPQMTEEIIQQYQAEQKALYEGPIESPYRLDIQKGDIAIKLPGQTEWSTLKEGDRIPSGSTIFTGMDSTTVLSIRDKGVIHVQSFTEITVTEKGLEEAAKTGQTYTDIELRTGEVELNVPGGVFTGSLQVHTPNSTTGVRGTHFWVSYDKDKKLSTTGVYRGQVEVKTKDGKTVEVSPNGDKPGAVVVSQKLSIVKLAIAGLASAVIIGGATLILKSKFIAERLSKKKK